jgi:hypothetical protein
MALLLAIYLVFAIRYAIVLLGIDEIAARIMGVALIVLPLVGAWTLFAELRFGFRTEKLAKTLESEGGLPENTLPVLPSGRPERDAANAEFPRYQAEVEADPTSWRAWFRLGLAYDASGDRKRARWATREAITLHQADAAAPASRSA